MLKRLLVVDDYQDSREMLELIFRQAGFVVFLASDGAEALVTARDHRPHAVVMDLFMPVMDGFEATRQIKADPSLRHVPVIAYSAKASSAHEDDYLFAAICQKPCPPDDLIGMVNEVIKHFRGQAALIRRTTGGGSIAGGAKGGRCVRGGIFREHRRHENARSHAPRKSPSALRPFEDRQNARMCNRRIIRTRSSRRGNSRVARGWAA